MHSIKHKNNRGQIKFVLLFIAYKIKSASEISCKPILISAQKQINNSSVYIFL